MKTKTLIEIAIILAIIIGFSTYYYTFQLNTSLPIRKGETAIYDYYIQIYGNSTYYNQFTVKILSVSLSNISFEYRYTVIQNKTILNSKNYNTSFLIPFNPQDNLTYFVPGSFGMPLFINTSSQLNKYGSLMITYQGGENMYIVYNSTINKGSAFVNLTLIPSINGYMVGASEWNLIYNINTGLLTTANGTVLGNQRIDFFYKLVNYSE